MTKNAIILTIAIVFNTTFLNAMEKSPEEQQEAAFFWSTMSASGLLLINGVAMYSLADYYDDEAEGFVRNRTKNINTASTFWTAAVISMGASTAFLLLGLKRRYDLESPLAVIPDSNGNTLIAYRFRF